MGRLSKDFVTISRRGPSAGRKGPGKVIVAKGGREFGHGVSLNFDKDLVVDASARDALEFCGTALRDHFEESLLGGHRFDDGDLPRDATGWVGYETGLLARNFRFVVEGDDRRAGVRVWLRLPDARRAFRVAQLRKEGIVFTGLSGKAADVYAQALAQYMSGVVHS
jgi:hypothetical protein